MVGSILIFWSIFKLKDSTLGVWVVPQVCDDWTMSTVCVPVGSIGVDFTGCLYLNLDQISQNIGELLFLPMIKKNLSFFLINLLLFFIFSSNN